MPQMTAVQIRVAGVIDEVGPGVRTNCRLRAYDERQGEIPRRAHDVSV